METSLHRQLKQMYADSAGKFEVRVGKYRIDALCGRRLVEIQHGTLGAIRDKIATLLATHSVLIVKPIVASKLLVKLAEKGGEIVGRRLSPKRGQILDLFDELVHFTRTFPHRRLTLEVPLVEIEERRYPGHGRRRRWSRSDFQIEDQLLVRVQATHRFRTAADLLALLPTGLPQPFDTGQLAERMNVARARAQRIAFCLHRMGALRMVDKRGNARLYEIVGRRRLAASA